MLKGFYINWIEIYISIKFRFSSEYFIDMLRTNSINMPIANYWSALGAELGKKTQWRVFEIIEIWRQEEIYAIWCTFILTGIEDGESKGEGEGG